jgi:superfamily II helicase
MTEETILKQARIRLKLASHLADQNKLIAFSVAALKVIQECLTELEAKLELATKKSSECLDDDCCSTCGREILNPENSDWDEFIL